MGSCFGGICDIQLRHWHALQKERPSKVSGARPRALQEDGVLVDDEMELKMGRRGILWMSDKRGV